MNPPKPVAIADQVALAKIRRYLSPLRGYNRTPEAESRLVEVVQASCVSVEHLDAVLETFDGEYPTLREIKDVALNLRERFLPPAPPLKAQWEAQGYTLDPTYYQQVQEQMQSRGPGQPREIDLMYRAVKSTLGIKDWTKVSWGEIWSTARDLGFPLNTEQREDAARWEKLRPKSETRPPAPERKVSNGGTNPPRLITQADIDAARRKRAADAKGGEDGRETE